jgi:hypothetical protein
MYNPRERALINDLLIEELTVQEEYIERLGVLSRLSTAHEPPRMETLKSIQQNIELKYKNDLSRLRSKKVKLTARLEQRDGKMVNL